MTMFSSIRSLKELHADRQLRLQPFLAFESGGAKYPVRFVRRGKHIPGIEPAAVAAHFPHLSGEAESVDLDCRVDKKGHVDLILIGNLKNYGVGPALEIEVTWIAETVWIHGEKFDIDTSKRAEPIYSTAFNTIPAMTQHIMPNQTTGLPRLPTFIEKDTTKKVERVAGHLLISCQDIGGLHHIFKQGFNIFTKYAEAQPSIVVTMGDITL